VGKREVELNFKARSHVTLFEDGVQDDGDVQSHRMLWAIGNFVSDTCRSAAG
jgi:hypothetical protein